MGSDEAFSFVGTPVSNSVGVPELDDLLKEFEQAIHRVNAASAEAARSWLDSASEPVNAAFVRKREAADAIRTLFASTRSPETHSEREPDGWRIEKKMKANPDAPWHTDISCSTDMDRAEAEGYIAASNEGPYFHARALPVYFGTPPAVVDTTREDVEVCEWRPDCDLTRRGYYDAACGFNGFMFYPDDDRYRFCPKCGKPLRVVEKDGEE